MLYCEPCRLLIETGERCPHCHRLGREVRAEDLCVFTEQNSLWTDLLEGMLQEEHVPFIRRPTSGVAPLLGACGTHWEFLTPYAHYAEARAVTQDMLAPDERMADITEEEPLEDADED